MKEVYSPVKYSTLFQNVSITDKTGLSDISLKNTLYL